MPSRILRGGALALALSFFGAAIGWSALAAADRLGEPRADTLAAIPADNPQTPEKVALGRRLFFDPRLSADGTVACGSCHQPQRAFTDGRATAVGVRGLVGQRNAPTILNALYEKTLFWDGRVTTLEDQALLPIVNTSEMGRPNLDSAVAAIAADARDRSAFARVFGRAPNAPDLARAIAAYERSELAFASPFDAFAAGDKGALSDAAKRGWALFNGKGRCAQCHEATTPGGGALFMDQGFHNTGAGLGSREVTALACKTQARLGMGSLIAVDQAAIASELSALGAFLVTKAPADIAAFKTPSLRNVAVTAPYFHDGSARTLWDVLDHYNKGGVTNPWLDRGIRPLRLTEPEIGDLIAFLASLTSTPFEGQAARELARQQEIARTERPQRDRVRAFARPPPRPDPAQACLPAGPPAAPRQTAAVGAVGR
jgi:cytochrome c peroxidase